MVPHLINYANPFNSAVLIGSVRTRLSGIPRDACHGGPLPEVDQRPEAGLNFLSAIRIRH
jgi:hypothetical protein